MTAGSTLDSSTPATSYGEADAALARQVRRDQLAAVRRAIRSSIPVNAMLGLAVVCVSAYAGRWQAGLIWFAASSIVNASRIALCGASLPLPGSGPIARLSARIAPVEAQLDLHSLLAFVSGVVWAHIAFLCNGYTSPETIFFLVVVCGNTAGAVTHGFAYARVPIGFIVPPLLTIIVCLVHTGSFERICLVATVLLYLGALCRSTTQSESLVRDASRLKHQATAMARSLEAANAEVTQTAAVMRQRAIHDGLTGLLNRSGFMEAAERSVRKGGTPCALLLLDLDGFKAVNDVYGHGAGDAVLIEVARRIRQSVPEPALVARLGGDEFVILCEVEAGDAAPLGLAEDLIAAIAIPFLQFDAGRVGVSVGVRGDATGDIDDMLTCADAALYAAKSAGRNRAYLFDAELRRRLEMRRDIERDLLRALGTDALEVWYQPILDDGARSVDSLEALLRWKHPRHGWIAPPEIVEAASITGLSQTLLHFILKDVCGMIETLDTMGAGHVRVAMNVSPREMAQLPVDEIVLAKLKKREIPHHRLEIEITEETALDIEAVQGKIRALSEVGVRIAIDDFGVGYSSLGSLRRLRVDRVKIDRAFIDGIAGSPTNRVLVEAILTLGHSLGFEVVAEGIEAVEDLEALRDLGCQSMQGYYLSKPMAAHEAIAWVRRRMHAETDGRAAAQ